MKNGFLQFMDFFIIQLRITYGYISLRLEGNSLTHSEETKLHGTRNVKLIESNEKLVEIHITKQLYYTNMQK